MKRRSAIVIATLALHGARAAAAEPAPDADFLEFLGSQEGDDESFDRYLLSRELPARRQPTTTEARPTAAKADDPDAP